jgi:hypothetical protein
MATQDSIENPAPPSLPLATTEYERRYQDQYSNVLRLYFNRLQNSLSTLFNRLGGRFLNFPYGAFQNNATITLSTVNTPTLVPMLVTGYANGMYSVPGDGIHVQQAGLYNYQFSIQLRNTDTQIHDAFVWLRKNGVDIVDTMSAFSITSRHGGVDGYVIGAANFFIDMVDGDYVEMWWAASSTQIEMYSIPAISSPYTRPLSPAVVATLSFVSSLPA